MPPPALPPVRHYPLQLQPALQPQWLGQVQGGPQLSSHHQGLSWKRHLQRRMQSTEH